MPILVTGAGGLIGSNVVRQLSALGEKVIALDLVDGPQASEDVVFESGSVMDFKQLANAVVKHNVNRIVHLAALVLHRTYDAPYEALNVNVMGFANILEAVRTFQIERLVYASSVSIYGPTSLYSRPVAEQDPYFLTHLYGATKAMNEATAAHYTKLFGLDTIGIRPHYSFGPGRYDGSAGQFNALIRACATGRVDSWASVFKEGTILAPIHVSDMAGAFVHAVRGPKLPSPVYNVGGAEPLTEDQMVAVVGELTGNNLPNKISGGMQYGLDMPEVDCKLYETESGFRPAHSFRSAVQACIDYFRENANA